MYISNLNELYDNPMMGVKGIENERIELGNREKGQKR